MPRPEAAARPGPGPALGRRPRGRPPSGARERILAAGLEVLKADGYAGLTTAKVAARSGQNKALIAYHFGSKHGLVAAVGREVGESIAEEILAGIEGAAAVAEIVRGMLDGLWQVMDRDVRLARLYFDLAAVSVVEPDVRAVMREIKAGWRRVLIDLLVVAPDGPPRRRAEAAAVYLIASVEGLALERIERGDTRALRRAADMVIRTAPSAVSGAA